MRLVYIGRLLAGYSERVTSERENPRLWNLIEPGHPHHLSSIGLRTLRDLGLLERREVKRS